MLIEILDDKSEQPPEPRQPRVDLNTLFSKTNNHANKLNRINRIYSTAPMSCLGVISLFTLLTTYLCYKQYYNDNTVELARLDELMKKFDNTTIVSIVTCKSQARRIAMSRNPCAVEKYGPEINLPAVCLAIAAEACDLKQKTDSNYLTVDWYLILSLSTAVMLMLYCYYHSLRPARAFLTEAEFKEMNEDIHLTELAPLLASKNINLSKYLDTLEAKNENLQAIKATRVAFYSALRNANKNNPLCKLRHNFFDHRYYDDNITKTIFEFVEPENIIKPKCHEVILSIEADISRLDEKALNRKLKMR